MVIIKPPPSSKIANTPRILGAAAMVCSCTWVTACKIPTTRPMPAAMSTAGRESIRLSIIP